MGEGFYFIDILIFGMVAAFLIYRLRSVLGRRTGEEQQRPNPYATPPGQQGPGVPPPRPTALADDDRVVPLPGRGPVTEPPPGDGLPTSLADGVRQIQTADPTFQEKHFLQGAHAAFEMIVDAFARGDTAALRPLLADTVYDNFAEAIRARQAAGETLETRIHETEAVDLAEARLDGRTAFCTVRFTTQQTNVTRNAAGEVIDGEEDKPVEVVDLWTFSRNTRSRDPNWVLVETRTV
ncbi:MAG TPA: Tim44/TimA family putative adaptor protein [Azospirillaceae bacterium]|nr:Tim44/TimA family putative adaptor protein [Azospirillaceae bacterium]